jgi:hypothetical protein
LYYTPSSIRVLQASAGAKIAELKRQLTATQLIL